MPDVRSPVATVVVSTYNRPHYLVRTLQGFEQQTFRDFELIIADDGSDATSRAAADDFLKQSPLVVSRVWQEDEGFRKTKILNKAVEAARTDYLIFTDGDCVPFPDFVELHLHYRAPKTFLSAGAVRLDSVITARILDGSVPVSDITDLQTLKAHGMHVGVKQGRMWTSEGIRAVLDATLPIKKTFNGLNASCWKAAAVHVGGFNEAMGYGGEDVEFGLRLQAAGVKPLRVRHRIRALHLDHDKPYATANEIARNYQIRDSARRALAAARPSGPEL